MQCVFILIAFITNPFLYQNQPSRESFFCGRMGAWWITRALTMLKFVLKNRHFSSWRVDGRTSWWEDVLMVGRVDERTSWWENELMVGRVDERTGWRECELVECELERWEVNPSFHPFTLRRAQPFFHPFTLSPFHLYKPFHHRVARKNPSCSLCVKTTSGPYTLPVTGIMPLQGVCMAHIRF